MGANGVGKDVTDLGGALLDERQSGLRLGDSVVPVAGGQAHIGDRPVIERESGEVAGPLGFRAARPQHDVGLAQAVGVGEGRPMPQAGVGPHGLAALGDGDRSLREGHGPIDETVGEGHHRQRL